MLANVGSCCSRGGAGSAAFCTGVHCCRFQAHFKRWVEQKSPFTQEQKDWVAKFMSMPLPPFHLHMHIAACQEKNSISKVAKAGTGIGEPTEIMNAFMSLAGVTLQYATLAGRALWLEVLFHRWNQQKLCDLPRLLVDSAYRAEAKLAQLQEQQQHQFNMAVQLGCERGQLTEPFYQEVSKA